MADGCALGANVPHLVLDLTHDVEPALLENTSELLVSVASHCLFLRRHDDGSFRHDQPLLDRVIFSDPASGLITDFVRLFYQDFLMQSRYPFPDDLEMRP